MDPQRLAIETIDRNVSLEASAGTGKTYVLTRRFMEILKRGHLPKGREISSILAITFTNKAAREMKERIEMLVDKEREADPTFPYTAKDLHSAHIQTIHSFCHDQLKRYGRWIGVPSDFSVAEEWESDYWLRQSVLEALKESRDFVLDLSPSLEIYSTSEWVDLVTELYRSVYLRDRVEVAVVLERTRGQWEQAADALPSIHDLVTALKSLRSVVSGQSHWKKILSDDLLECLEHGDPMEEPGLECLAAIASCESTSKGQEEAIENVKAMASAFWMAKEEDFEAQYGGLVKLLERVRMAYEAIKSRHKKVDFSDLEESMIVLLEHEAICRELQNSFHYMMVDECQDTNERQRLIFEKLSTREKPYDRQNLFVVGDPKQSIYRFRGASVEEYVKLCEGIRDSGGHMLSMTKSYRFTAPVAAYLNRVFSLQWPDGYEPIQRPEDDTRSAIFESIVDSPPITLLSVEKGAEEDRYAMVVDHMMYLHGQGVPWSKMALMGRTKLSLRPYMELMSARHISYRSEIKGNLFDRQEVLDLVFLVRLIDDDNDVLALAQFLRSPLGAMKDASVVKVIKGEALADEVEQQLYETALDVLASMRAAAKENGIAFALRVVLTLADADRLSMPEDLRSQHNREAFIALVAQWEREYWGDTRKLLQMIPLWKAGGWEETGTFSGEDDAVEVLTIHKSKGLEFDYVFLPELNEAERIDYPKIVYHPHVGLAIKRSNQTFYRANRACERQYGAEDAKTLLYVALSRAKKGLILGTNIISGKSKMHDVLQEAPPKDTLPVYDELPKTLEKNVFKESSDEVTVHSATSFLTYQQCPLEYYYRYIKKQEPDKKGSGGGYGIALGNALHHFACAYRSDCDQDALLAQMLREQGIPPGDEVEKRAVAMARRWIDWFQGVSIKSRELPFAMMDGSDLISGVIDAVIEEDGELVIVDYKTNAFTTEEEREALVKRYQYQLYLYYEALKKRAKTLRLLFLQDGSVVDIQPTERDMQDYYALWQSYLKGTKNSKEEGYKEGRCHRYCPYVSCVYRKEGD